MPVKIEKRRSRGIRMIGDWSRPPRKLSDPPDHERRAMIAEKNPVKMKHAKIKPPKEKKPKVHLVKVRMLKTIMHPLSPFHAQEFKKGEVYKISEHYAEKYFKNGIAEKVKEGDKK